VLTWSWRVSCWSRVAPPRIFTFFDRCTEVPATLTCVRQEREPNLLRVRKESRPFYLGWESVRYDRTRPEGEQDNFRERVGFEKGSERREKYRVVYRLHIVADGYCAIQQWRRWVKCKYWTGLVQERSPEALRRCKMCSWRRNGQCGRIETFQWYMSLSTTKNCHVCRNCYRAVKWVDCDQQCRRPHWDREK